MTHDIIGIEYHKNKRETFSTAAYRECEFNIVPCGGADGKQTLEEWARYQTERVPHQTITRWCSRQMQTGGRQWRNDGVQNWCVLCGVKPWSNLPGIVCLDADDNEAIGLVKTFCPDTPLKTITPRGGIHFFYRCDDRTIRPAKGVQIMGTTYNLDIRANGSYCMLPGSYNPKHERCYVTNKHWTPELIASLPIYSRSWLPVDPEPEYPRLPAEIVADIVAKASRVPLELRMRLATEWCNVQHGATEGTGADCYAFSLAMQLVWGFLLIDSPDAIDSAKAILHQWGQRPDQLDANGRHWPWKWKTIAHKVNDAARNDYQGLPGDLFAHMLRYDREERANQIIYSANEQIGKGKYVG